MIDLIHIGDYKTGTSWLQQQFFSEHSELFYVDSGAYPEVVHLMHQLVDQRDLDFDAGSLREKFTDALRGIDSKNKKIVISREVLSGTYPSGDHAKRIAERLHLVFGDTKVFLVVREQFSMLKTIYSQYIKMGGTLNFKEFVYDPVISPGLIEKLKYHKIIDTYVNLFGEDNVLIGLFEEFKSKNQYFAKRVLNFIDCTDDWHLVEKKCVINPSLRKAGIAVQRFANHFLRNNFNSRKPLFPIDRIAALFLSQKKKQKLLDITRNRLVYSRKGYDDEFVLRYAINFGLTVRLSVFCERIQIGPKLSVPVQIVDDLKGEFVESNKLLCEKYGLPVDKFGWTL